MSDQKPSFAAANPGEFYVCQDWNHERWFQVREEMDNGDMAGRMSKQIAGGLSKEKAESVALALNSHGDLLEALEACMDAGNQLGGYEQGTFEHNQAAENWEIALMKAINALKKAKP